ncbi:copper chaperone PCu(A)C [Pelagibacterium sp. H642]|uniref:copper chaperone PCu(A)C n=1 Tax=Pelagibacterium sp. H642 TaxID=1881069 RepID=UPI002816798D|nr:copper chaperone PCu(A)C [Pelagibacterium sp. H642]WMT91194.1 copper chaperone PCu(A)C [Pelagibacterium sp. H642]
MISILSRAALAAATVSVFAAPAFAHMTFQNGTSAPGESFRGVLILPHGCDGAPTDRVRVNIPQGFADAQAEAKEGWTLDAGEGHIEWSGGSVADDAVETFAFTGTFAQDAHEVDIVFPVEQYCGDVALGWDPVVSLGEGGADAHAHAQDGVTVGDLTISGAFTRATLPNAPVGGGYVTITNTGDEADRLLDAQSSFSPDVQIHKMAVVNDVMQMSQLPDGLEIPAGETVTLEPGGLHLMFMDISQPFVEGETVPVTLSFERAGDVEIELAVQAFGASGMSSGHEGH